MSTIPINNSIQMSTPINSLPLKTNGEDVSLPNDPLIQNVLNEFESNKPKEISYNIPTPIIEPPSEPVNMILKEEQPVNNMNDKLIYNKKRKPFINMDVFKKTSIIVFVVIIVYNTSILEKIVSKLPESISKFLQGNEIYTNILITFIIFYFLFLYEYI